jgi:hypothetical protein
MSNALPLSGLARLMRPAQGKSFDLTLVLYSSLLHRKTDRLKRATYTSHAVGDFAALVQAFPVRPVSSAWCFSVIERSDSNPPCIRAER